MANRRQRVRLSNRITVDSLIVIERKRNSEIHILLMSNEMKSLYVYIYYGDDSCFQMWVLCSVIE
jgi:hypothetical protein